MKTTPYFLPCPPSMSIVSSHDVPGRAMESWWSHAQVPSLDRLSGRWGHPGNDSRKHWEGVGYWCGRGGSPGFGACVLGAVSQLPTGATVGPGLRWNVEWPVWTAVQSCRLPRIGQLCGQGWVPAGGR